MWRWLSESGRGRVVVGTLFALVLALRILVPTGFMPTRDAQGIVISLCTGQGAIKTVLPASKTDGQSGHDQGDGGSCVFAAGLGSGLLDVDVAGPGAVADFSHGVPRTRAIADLTVHRLAAPPPPAQAPPARA